MGVVAAGVAKAKADHITVSGHDGGTGAAVSTTTISSIYNGLASFAGVGCVCMCVRFLITRYYTARSHGVGCYNPLYVNATC